MLLDLTSTFLRICFPKTLMYKGSILHLQNITFWRRFTHIHKLTCNVRHVVEYIVNVLTNVYRVKTFTRLAVIAGKAIQYRVNVQEHPNMF
jgi:predicted transcriptional regulator